MKKFVSFLLAVLPFSLFAQKEITLSFGSGLFHFNGSSAVDNSNIIVEGNKFYYTGFYPYGKIPGISFNLSANFQKVDSSKFIYGFIESLDYFNTKVYVDQIELDSYYNHVNSIPRKVVNTIYEVSFSPFIGKRIKISNINLDIIGGVEFAIPFYSESYTKVAESNGSKRSLKLKREFQTETFDFRPTIKLTGSYKKIGIFFQYSNGLKNHAPDHYGDIVRAQLTRFGVNYWIYKS